MQPGEWKQQLRGVFSFPVTPFKVDLSVDLEGFCANVDRFCESDLTAIFVCCGTGEFHALSLAEYRALLKAAKDVVGKRKPLFACTGMGILQAVEFAKVAQDAGVDGLLAAPPYLITPPQDGLVSYYQQIARSTELPIILYQRANAVFTVEGLQQLSQEANIIGVKDGVGNMENLRRLTAAHYDRFAWISGMPTAEMSFEAFYAAGIETFSSAIANFDPTFGPKFHQAVTSGDRATCTTMLNSLVIPICNIRDRKAGYAVSFVKSAMNLMGFPAGPVRPPLVDMTEQDEADLGEVLQHNGYLS